MRLLLEGEFGPITWKRRSYLYEQGLLIRKTLVRLNLSSAPYRKDHKDHKDTKTRRKDKHTKTKKLSLRERSPDHKNSGETQSIKDVDPEMKRG